MGNIFLKHKESKTKMFANKIAIAALLAVVVSADDNNCTKDTKCTSVAGITHYCSHFDACMGNDKIACPSTELQSRCVPEGWCKTGFFKCDNVEYSQADLDLYDRMNPQKSSTAPVSEALI